MMGRLKSDQGQLFYEFRLGNAVYLRSHATSKFIAPPSAASQPSNPFTYRLHRERNSFDLLMQKRHGPKAHICTSSLVAAYSAPFVNGVGRCSILITGGNFRNFAEVASRSFLNIFLRNSGA